MFVTATVPRESGVAAYQLCMAGNTGDGLKSPNRRLRTTACGASGSCPKR